MSFEPVTQRRSYVDDSPMGFTIVVPARKQWFSILFLLVWLGGWTMGEISALRVVFGPGVPGGPTAFLIFWLCGWTFGGLFVVYSLLWMLAGSERITVSSGALTIRKQVFGFGREKAFELGEISELRVNRDRGRSSRASGGLTLPDIGGMGSVAFDYGAKTVRFAAGIDEAEAALIVNDLSSRYSFKNA